MSHEERKSRYNVESSHWRQRYRLFNSPFTIWSSSSTSTTPTEGGAAEFYQLQVHERLLDWRPSHTTTATKKTLDQLTSDDSRMFCFKDCALYLVGTSQSQVWWRAQLFEKIYRRWYPSRAQDTDLSHGNFFCHLMAFQNVNVTSQPPPARASIKEVLVFHESLCARLNDLVPEIPSEAVPTAHSVLLTPPTEYRLRPTFKECFIYIHTEHDDHNVDSQEAQDWGVIVVWFREEDATRHGCVVDPERGITGIDDDDLDGARAFRCNSLELAMRLVLSTDPQRSARRREWHEVYDEEVSNEDDTTPIAKCICSSCKKVAGEARPGQGPGAAPTTRRTWLDTLC